MDNPDVAVLFLGTSLVSVCVLLFCCGTLLCGVMLMKAGVVPILCCIRGCSSHSMWTDLQSIEDEDMLSFPPTVGDKDANLFEYTAAHLHCPSPAPYHNTIAVQITTTTHAPQIARH